MAKNKTPIPEPLSKSSAAGEFGGSNRLGDRSDDLRSPLAVGMAWASRVTTVAMEMVAPALIGYWLDQRWGTKFVLLSIGAVLGFVLGLRSLIQLTQKNPRRRTNDRRDS